MRFLKRSIAAFSGKAGSAGGRPAYALPPGERIYAIGDIHGRFDCLGRLLPQIALDRRGYNGRVSIVFLGDYVDRGPESRKVLDLLSSPKLKDSLQSETCIFLRGNHEDVMLRFLSEPSLGPEWANFGGLETLRSYKALQGLPVRPSDWRKVSEALLSHMPPEHLAFLQATSFCHHHGPFFFAHAGVLPGVALDAQSPEDLMWIRDTFLRSRAEHGALIIHGHSPSATPDIRDNRIGIDTGAYLTGLLTAAVIEGDGIRFIDSGDAQSGPRCSAEIPVNRSDSSATTSLSG